MPICDGCGRFFSADEAGSTQDTRTDAIVEGGLVYHRTEQVKFCPACARSRGGLVWTVFLAVLLILAGVLALALMPG